VATPLLGSFQSNALIQYNAGVIGNFNGFGNGIVCGKIVSWQHQR
jgi:hypothetical protein